MIVTAADVAAARAASDAAREKRQTWKCSTCFDGLCPTASRLRREEQDAFERAEATIVQWIAQGCREVVEEESIESRIVAFITKTWGAKNATDLWERSMRVVEEAIEFAQANGITETMVRLLTTRVYNRTPGGQLNEAAGLGVTLVAWCAANAVSLDGLLHTEIQRIEGMDREKLRAKQREKAADGFGLDIEEDQP